MEEPVYDNYVVASHTDTDILMCQIYIFMHTHSKGFCTAQRVHDLTHLTCLLSPAGVKDCPHWPLRGRIDVYSSLFRLQAPDCCVDLLGCWITPEPYMQ